MRTRRLLGSFDEGRNPVAKRDGEHAGQERVVVGRWTSSKQLQPILLMTLNDEKHLNPTSDFPIEDDHISSLQLVGFAVVVVLLILIPSCCWTPIHREKAKRH